MTNDSLNQQPSKTEDGEQLEKANGTANLISHATEAAAAAVSSEDGIEERQHARGARKTPSLSISEVTGDSNRPTRVVSADSFYGYGAGINEQLLADQEPTAPDADERVPPPAYESNVLGEISDDNHGLGTNASVADDGRVNIRIDQRSHKLSSLLVPALRNQRQLISDQQPPPPPYIPPSLGGSPGELPPPPLNIVIHVVGSRGDVQPFLALGKVLKETYNHRVRLATHPVFKDFIEENGLEFFSIGGDPSELMAFMVKNPGLMPGFDTLRNGDVGKRRKGIAEMIRGCWRSCIEAGDGTGVEASDASIGDWMSNDASGITVDEATSRPFVADAIIANPPSFAHVHCAERLGIPLHMMFTMPWSPTESFPHPLANIEASNAEQTISNYITYALIDMLTWQGLGDVINRFRVHILGLEPISLVWAPGLLARLRVPYTYCWSPALIPKPPDWGPHISISGFFFLSLASNYAPAPDLVTFLNAGPPPVYIGFGSIVVDDPNEMTNLIFEAVKKTGQRALVSKGWGGLGADQLGVPEGVFMLGNVPHDWLFNHVSCVVHHGGAGTTAAGIACGKPTVIVPFFGDQPFWGAMVARAGAGPTPIPYKKLTADDLASAIMEALKPSSQDRAKDMAAKISKETGTNTGAQSFHQMLDVDKLRCSILPDNAAVWRVKRTKIRLSAVAAYVLAEKEVISFADLKLYRSREYDTEMGPTDPISGGAGAVVETLTSTMMGFADFPVATLKALAIHPDASKGKGKGKLKGNGTMDSTSATALIGVNSLTPRSFHSANASGTSLSVDTTSTGPTPPPTPGSTKPKATDLAAAPDVLSRESTLSIGTTDTNISTIQSTPSSQDSSRLTSTQTAPRGSSLAEALRNLSNSTRPRSHSRSRSPSHRRSNSESKPHRSWSEASPGPDLLDTAYGTGKGVTRIVGAGLKSPMDLLLGVSKGFHNMPKLYGEEVRQTDRVTGVKSGLRTAGKEFGLGMFDGITGLVTQPLTGAKKEGAAGFVKGVGKGIAGLVIKPGAGIYGLPGYAMKGVYKEIQKHFGASVSNYIIAARTAQGWEAWLQTDKDQQTEIVHRYLRIVEEVKRKKIVGEDQVEAVQEFIEKSKERRREKWVRISDAYRGKKKEWTDGLQAHCHPSQRSNITGHRPSGETRSTSDSEGSAFGSDYHPLRPSVSHSHSTGSMPHAATFPMAQTHYQDAEGGNDMDEAIRQSVMQHSTGDEEEDRLVDRAIRASIAELQKSGSQPTDNEDEQEQLRKAIEESMRSGPPGNDWNTPSPSTIAGASSSAPPIPPRSPRRPRSGLIQEDSHDDKELRKALEESLRADEEKEKQRMEEEIVLEYVKKQSRLEEEHRRRMIEEEP